METNKQESNRPVTYWIGEGAGWLLRHVVSGLAATGMTPNMFTFLGLAVNSWAAALFAYGAIRAGCGGAVSRGDFWTWRMARWRAAWDA